MPVVAVGPDKKRIDLPEAWVEHYQKGNVTAEEIKAYAVATGQATNREVGYEPPSGVESPMQAALISAGATLTRLGSDFRQVMGEITGNEARVQRERGIQSDLEQSMEPVRREFPKSSFAGEMLPGFAVPGGKAIQAGVGALEGALAGETPGERAAGAAIGLGAGLVGQKIGSEISQRLTPKVQKALGSQLGKARAILAREGVPLTFGQRGSPVGRFVDVLKSTITRKQPLQDQQIRVLNRLAARAIGERSDDLSKATLGRAHSRIGRVYEAVAEDVSSIPIGPDHLSQIALIDEAIEEVTDPVKVRGARKILERAVIGDLSGDIYNSARQKLGRISRQLWNQGNGLEAEVVDSMMEVLDDALEAAAPDSQAALAVVRPQWRFLRALRRGSAVTDGSVNPRSMNSAMEAVYPGFDVGSMPKGEAGRFGTTLDAFRQVIRPFRSSGTAERVAALGAPLLAGAGITGMAGPVAGGAATTALLLSGGGAGAAAGGNLSRELALQLANRDRLGSISNIVRR